MYSPDFCRAYQVCRPGGEPLPLAQAPISEALATGDPVRDREAMLERPDDTHVTILANVDPLFDQDGRSSAPWIASAECHPVQSQNGPVLM
jgi:hypothetical protein